ncbi:uncharacterized protein B0H64DRAFT_446816 [Chaetomium fimeti]|uniref:Uncharacterized protein n=1 Tax=Chaetomium fimeti TaxID=1854472 RepID=A0AAE0LMV1_9PEZI|nr:hypothetical protein B0H64DRAFT_446816 [Chaetomium fimeti]
MVSVNDPEAYSVINGFRRVFTTRCVSVASTPQTEAKIQPLVDLLLNKLNELGQAGQKPVDTVTLTAHFAFDAMGIINVSDMSPSAFSARASTSRAPSEPSIKTPPTSSAGSTLLASEPSEASKPGIPKPTHEQTVAFVFAKILDHSAGYATGPVALRSIRHHLARNRPAYARLQRQPDDAFTPRALS